VLFRPESRRGTLCVAKIKNEQIALPGDYFQRMGLAGECSVVWLPSGATRSFESGIAMRTSLFVALKVNGRVQFSPAVDSGRCSAAVMQPTESRPGNDLAADRGCGGRNSTAGSVLTESEVGPIFVIVADVIFHQPPQMPLVQNNHVVQ
jgi:hypothetical protein